MSAPTHSQSISNDLTMLRALNEPSRATDVERHLGQPGAYVAPIRLRKVLTTDQVHVYRVRTSDLGNATVYRRIPLGDKALANAALAQERPL